ncbi:MAG: 16S rRNA (cytidine(1402)-2'-O)-methyltransferase [Candidatus Lumbricidophila eiseniae]|uniref:Ribosomal RNA small subunit methyltransferase I n=1 Tax=Candidatus Lumbricidiphila eiseniae TaxID=1969409 RepID=A0A2A6FQC4_9MICO|nr:MAG: 16S rRNA (cytidine(1402)-2'-O)-methyltransferase [Candidatus Lumbricidophila eiseniae]
MLILGATPIGNLGDASPRLRDALDGATTIASEDTRVTQRLLVALGVTNRPRLIALHEHNERQRAADIVELARESDVLVLSDAGMPTVSDPGFPLVTHAVEAGVRVTVIPGPSAVTTALALSGLPTNRFAFEGFLPRRAGELARALSALTRERRTLVFFEAPSRIAATLTAMATAFGPDRRAAVCRELTKLHEEVRRGSLGELAEWAAGGVRGEVCVVVAGAEEEAVGTEAAVARVRELVASGYHTKDAAALVAAETGMSKRDLYQAALNQ